MVRLTTSPQFNSPLINEDELKSLFLDPNNVRIRKNLRVFELSIEEQENGELHDNELGLSIENFATFLQKQCKNIQRIGCLKSWSWKPTRNGYIHGPDFGSKPVVSPVPLDSFLLPGFKLVKSMKCCECCDIVNNPSCGRIIKDLTFE